MQDNTHVKNVIITGGAGFIGSHMADFLLAKGVRVKVVDNFSTGKMRFIEHNLQNPMFSYETADIKDQEALTKAFCTWGVEKQHYDIVFHFAANADVKGNVTNPTKCLHENGIGTSNVLEAMRANNIKKIVFSSTGSIYGEPEVFPTPEDAPFPIQTSMYGASKAYGEGLISAYCEAYGMQSWIYRFVSILGERYTHGVVFSFYQQLMLQQQNNESLQMIFLSDGTPRKSFLYVGDCISGIWHGVTHANNNVNIFNLGTDEEIVVRELGEILVHELRLQDNVTYQFGKTQRGWIGDSPFIRLDIRKLQSLGWQPRCSIRDAIKKTAHYLRDNSWVLGEKYFRDT